MSSSQERWIAGLTGVFFGFLLCWTRFVDYDVIVGALGFKDLYLWKLFVSAVVTGFVGLRVLKSLGVRTLAGRAPIKWAASPVRREHILGGVIFGIGWAITGTCPGPAIAQLGLLHFAGIFTLAGMMAGIDLQDRLSGE